MDPVYPLIMFAAVLVCGLLLRRTQRLLPLPAADRRVLGVAAFCGAMIGAKLPYLAAGGPGVGAGVTWLGDGKTILAGLVGGYLAVELVKWLLGIRTKTGDTFAAPVAVAVAIGRLGCLRAGCCYGVPTGLPWGVVFPAVDGQPRHPTQLYESAFHLAMACLLLACQRRGLFRYQRLKLYIMAYAVYRLLTEAIRPEPAVALNLTAYQWASLVLLVVFGLLWRCDARLARVATGREVA